MTTKLTHLGLSIEDHITIDLDIDGVHVFIEVHKDVTVTALSASVKVAEQLSYGNGAQSVRMNIRQNQTATPEGFCECGTSIEHHAGMGCLYRNAKDGL